MPWHTSIVTAHDCEMEAETGKLARSSRARKLGVCSASAARSKTLPPNQSRTEVTPEKLPSDFHMSTEACTCDVLSIPNVLTSFQNFEML